MPQSAQLDLPLFRSRPDDPNIDYLAILLQGRGWVTAERLAGMISDATGVQISDRKIRSLAAASEGRIAGGQLGYKLVREMTNEEYQHYRSWMLSQADEMRDRIRKSDTIFYGRRSLG